MGILLLAAFIGVPLLEIVIFIKVGGFIGLWPTLGVVILTAMLGVWQLRLQGLATLARVQRQIDQGIMPTEALFDGVCLLVAGVLLLTPGFATDTCGFLLFIPQFRHGLRRLLVRHFQPRFESRVFTNDGTGGHQDEATVIDADYRDVTEAKTRGRLGQDALEDNDNGKTDNNDRRGGPS